MSYNKFLISLDMLLYPLVNGVSQTTPSAFNERLTAWETYCG